ncbi:MAG: hypothetical protein J6R40_05245, partial [Clostridia bacterium]|nr:hypothetical protein [Clostridia bacterium]
MAGDALLDWDSYTEETEMKMQLVVEGLILDINTKITGKMQGQKKTTMRFAYTAESVYSMLGNVSRTLIKEGYQNGKMYEYENGDGVQTRAMVSSVSAREYREYLYGSSDGGIFTDLAENAQSCTATATPRPDGGYTVNFSDFLQSAIDEMLFKMALSDTAA